MFLLEYFFHNFQSVMSISKYTALRDFLQVGGIFATGGYGLTRFYNKSSNYDKGAIIEAGIVLF